MVARGPDSLGTQWHGDQVAQGMGTHQHGPSRDTSPRCQPGATLQWPCHQAARAGPTCRKLAPRCWARTGPAGPATSPPARRGRRGHTGSIGGGHQGDPGGHGVRGTRGWPYQPVPVTRGQVEGADDVDAHQALLGLAGGQLLEVARRGGHPGVLGQGVETEKPLEVGGDSSAVHPEVPWPHGWSPHGTPGALTLNSPTGTGSSPAPSGPPGW